MTLDANPPPGERAGAVDGALLPLDCLRFFVPESMVPAAGELSTPRTWIPDRVPRAHLRSYVPEAEGPRRWLSPTLWGVASFTSALPAMAPSQAGVEAQGELEASSNDDVPVLMVKHVPRAARAAPPPVAQTMGIRGAGPPSTIWEAVSPCSMPAENDSDQAAEGARFEPPASTDAFDGMASADLELVREQSTLSELPSEDMFKKKKCTPLTPGRGASWSPCSGNEPLHIRQRPLDAGSQDAADRSSPAAFRGPARTQSVSQSVADSFRRSPW